MLGMGKKVDATVITSEVNTGKAILVDVRGNDEWESGHAKGAPHLSIDRIARGELPTKDLSKTVYVYCASGGRASVAASDLNKKGFTVENIGGLSSWRSAGGEVESSINL